MAKKWWQEAVVYEIYCKSFCDSNGDGIGDLKGVMSKLPMLKELGINTIWFTPIYKSPQVDNGYDVADYYDIDPAYGTLDDFKQLLDMAHSMGIRVIMDQVLNHSSDECVWFQESRKSKDNPYRNYYIWQPPKPDGSEPNNWGSYFREENGSAWKYDELTGEYYFHQYAIKMPDLNWEYEPLRQEIYKMLRWWVELGVDGFRLDVFTQFKKTPGFPDTQKAPNLLLDRNGFVVDYRMCLNVEGIHDFIKELHTEVFGPTGCMTVGEGSGVTSANALEYIHPDRKELDMVYHFELAHRERLKITAERFRRVQTNWARVFREGGWPVQYLSNHDSARQVSCYGDDKEYRIPSAKALAVLLHTTPGTPFVYQGEEIGMTNVRYDRIEDYNCRYTVGDYWSMMETGVAPEEALEKLAPRSRDNARTPYQWDNSENAGFTTGKPWLKVNPEYTQINLATERKDPNGIFAWYQKLIQMRKDYPAILDGDLEFLLEEHPQLVVYLRSCEEQTLLVVVNMGSEHVTAQLPEQITTQIWKRVATNFEENPCDVTETEWRPWQAEIFVLEQ